MLYCRLRVCGECGCNYECQCDCCCNMKQSVKGEKFCVVLQVTCMW